MNDLSMDRRSFLVSATVFAGGMALGAARAAGQPGRSGPWGADAPAGIELSPWIEIAPDDVVTVRVPTPEIGNGAMTQVAMNVTEELGCDWSKVRAEFASIHRDFVEGGSYTSGFLPFFSGHGTDPVRMKQALQLGASARERLKAAAAARWKVPVDEIETRPSLLVHQPTGRKLRFGEVAAEAGRIKLAAEPALKSQSEWTFLGKASPGKLNLPEMVKGETVYGIDVQLPGMVYAALMQAPAQGGRLKSHQPEAVLRMPGVRAVVVVDPAKTKGAPVKPKATFGLQGTAAQSGVAVIADHYWQAKMALDALPVEWDAGPGAQWTSTEAINEARRAILAKAAGKSIRKAGDVDAVSGGKVVEGLYATPLCENATLEPLNGTALVTGDAVEAWLPSQDQGQAFWVVVDETGIAPEKVKVHQTYVGGGFGRRTLSDDARMVLAVAKEYPGKPVKVIWSREETMRQGRYRNPVMTRFKAILDEQTGLPKAVSAEANATGMALPMGYADMPYFTSGIIPNVRLATSDLPLNILTGAYRAPCYNSHAFITETFIDECAIAAGIDPLEYRLRLLGKWDKSWSDCLKIAAEKAGWGKPLTKGEGRGIAISNWPKGALRNEGTTMCMVAHVAVSEEGTISVKQVDVAFDCGRVANQDAVRAQIEGGVIFGLNTALNEEVTVKDGAIVEGNFDEYPILRLADAPRLINVHFDALSNNDRFEMIGEAPMGPIGPAVGNAIFQATGKRLRTTPFRKHDLSRTAADIASETGVVVTSLSR
ncbi:xanthine dehydrogenase family protein molybdopterin-binding subunit [Sphingomonas cavernae]|nr:molybdopterin cofactor-binding domain-containing protein [Sphingomonas cavernae]